ncbi:MAG: glycosyltransferase family 2 protein [Planctomycetaceae bacterium]|nr:glycosyltransferase family 2 protein [Planctomycetaceae bacterium]
MPAISVVIPAYNAEGCVARAIESVLAQTQAVREIIVVDDGSRDATAAAVEQFGADVRLIRQSNAGPAAARNHGVREAHCEWIAFLDADDAWLPSKNERQAACLEQEQVGVVHCYVVDVAEKFKYDGEQTFDRLWRQNAIGTSTAIVRKSAWEAVGGFYEDRRLMGVEDYHFWLRVTAAGWRVAVCREELSHYTPAAFNLSSQVQHILGAELFNAELIANELQLPPGQLRAKQADIYAEYGSALFTQRDMPAARDCLTQELRRRPTLRSALRLAATFIPPTILNHCRNLRVRKPPTQCAAM